MRVFVWIEGLGGDFRCYVPCEDETLEDYAREHFDDDIEFFEVEPYQLDPELFRDELERVGISAKAWRVVRAISYDATNPDEFQEVEVVTNAH